MKPSKKAIGATAVRFKRYNRLLIFKDVRGCTLRDEIKLPFYLLDAYLQLKSSFRRNPISKIFKDLYVRVGWMRDSKFVIRAGTFMFVSVLPYREPVTYSFIESTLKPGDTFIDVGANVGAYAIPAAKMVGKKGLVVAVEPSPAKAFLKKNIKLNGLDNIKVVEKAAYKKKANLTFYYRPTITTRSSLIPDWEVGEVHKIKIPAASLDDMLRGVRKIRIMKIDVEGAEPEVLTGAKNALKRTEYVVFETEPSKLVDCMRLLSGFSKFYLLERIRGEKTANCLATKSFDSEIDSNFAALSVNGKVLS